MAAFIIACVLLPNFLILSAAASSSDIITLNQRLHADAALGPSAWYSPSRRFTFGFLPHDEGRSFLVAIWFTDGNQNTIIWTANRDDPPAPSNSTIELTASGKLLLNSGTPIADPPEPVAFASMLDSGNLVLYDQNSNSIWQSFDYPTDTIVSGQKLASGNQLISRVSPSNYSTGRFRLKMQMDGYLVAYPLNTEDIAPDAYWAMNGYNYLLLDNAGRLKLVGEGSSTQLNTNYSGDAMYRLTLDPDGIFRVYSHARAEPLWEAPIDTCQVKSFCGFNGYCTYNDTKPICYCVPGTVDNGDGCRSNFTKQACRDGKAEVTTYNITVELKLKWDDDAPYFVGPMSSEDDCKKSCLEDCDCDAAEYDYVNLFKVGTIRSFENGSSSSPAVKKKKTMTNWKLILVLVSCLVAYSSIALFLFAVFAFKTRVLEYKRLLESSASGLARELTVRSYSYNELKVATRGFKEELGKGSFGAVYKGTVKKIGSGEKVVAVNVGIFDKDVKEDGDICSGQHRCNYLSKSG